MDLKLYYNTIKYMKPSQVAWRLLKKCHISCTTGLPVISREQLFLNYDSLSEAVCPVQDVPELDFDPCFIGRFCKEEWEKGQITLLNEQADMDLFTSKDIWELKEKSALWNFNLHYFEYLFPFEAEGQIDIPMTLIRNWIQCNPLSKGGPGWSPYTIDLRLTNWISWYSRNHGRLPEEFRETMLLSMHRQYVYLSTHLEKDILGNHYFEDLKTLILCSVFFRDDAQLNLLLSAFFKECREEVLHDGMHFELSPMYHRIILEGIIRVTAALEGRKRDICFCKQLLTSMADAMYSIEIGTNRLPQFNDSGNNVSKSKEAILLALKRWNIVPACHSQFPESGFYIFQEGPWKLIIDAGQPGPVYIPGHAHCDALSYELFYKGKPVIVNCGTYAYQSELRNYFRSTEAHNTFRINGVEQSQFWGDFRLGKRSRVLVHMADHDKLIAEIRDQKGQRAIRSFHIDRKNQRLLYIDRTVNKKDQLESYLHITKEAKELGLKVKLTSGSLKWEKDKPYSEEYGKLDTVRTMCFAGTGKVGLMICLPK